MSVPVCAEDGACAIRPEQIALFVLGDRLRSNSVASTRQRSNSHHKTCITPSTRHHVLQKCLALRKALPSKATLNTRKNGAISVRPLQCRRSWVSMEGQTFPPHLLDLSNTLLLGRLARRCKDPLYPYSNGPAIIRLGSPRRRLDGSSGVDSPSSKVFFWRPAEPRAQASQAKAEPIDFHFVPLQGGKIMVGRGLRTMRRRFRSPTTPGR